MGIGIRDIIILRLTILMKQIDQRGIEESADGDGLLVVVREAKWSRGDGAEKGRESLARLGWLGLLPSLSLGPCVTNPQVRPHLTRLEYDIQS